MVTALPHMEQTNARRHHAFDLKASNKTRLRRFVGDCYIDRVTTGSEEAILEERSRDVRGRLEEVRLRMEKAARRRHRSPDEVKLIAVSKTHPPAAVRYAIECGVADLGENRVQEAEEKIPAVGRALARWHLIGHLQSNKARKAVELFDVIHSLDSVALAQRLDPRARSARLVRSGVGEGAAVGGPQGHALRVLLEELQVVPREHVAREEA